MPALPLSPARRSELRSQAHALNPVVLIGAEGLTKAVLAEIDRSLAAHGLIKIRVFGDDREARIQLYDTICARLQAAPVQHIGKLLVIWRDGPAYLKENQPKELHPIRKTTGAAPRSVVVRKPNPNSTRRPKPIRLSVLGNERVTAGGNVKRAKPRQASQKKKALS
ncbi:YhbY family RNA-binding protein [Ralstonia solanacearum]|uniref:YhbY family RNA-binding protein n=1 Tax=Ralstonia solanacearum TaxID=305 RepID=UPI0018D109BF|nr:YhbY family RNA-binding protein [Ralstonia solanacearum]